MLLTNKTIYGIKAFLDIAFHSGAGRVQRKQIRLRQSINIDYLDLVLERFKEKGLIYGFRGREGGYHLSLSPSEVSLLDILDAVEDKKISSNSQGENDTPYNPPIPNYLVEPSMNFLERILRRQLKKITMEMLLEEGAERLLEAGIDPIEIMEKRPVPTFVEYEIEDADHSL